MKTKLDMSLLVLLALGSIVVASSGLSHGSRNIDEFKPPRLHHRQSRSDLHLSHDEAVLTQLRQQQTQKRFHHRQPRSDPQPSHNEAVLTQLLQHVNLLTAKTELLASEVEDLRLDKDRLEAKVAILESRLSAVSVERNQTAKTVQQQGTALQALLVQFSSWRAGQDTSWLRHNQTVSALTADLSQIHNQFADLTLREETRWILHKQNLSVVIADVSQLHSDLLSIQISHNLTQGKVVAHTLTLAKLSGNVTSVDARTTDVERKTSDLQTWRSNVTADVSRIDMMQGNVRNDVSGILTQVSQAANASTQLQSDVLHLTDKQASLSRTVLFFASRTETQKHHNNNNPPNAVLFDKLPTNVGGAYDAATGNFTAPLAGDYFFSASSVSGTQATSGQPLIQLMLDSDSLLITTPHSPSIAAALRLCAGQRVWLRDPSGSSRFGRGMYFAGVLVRPL